MATPDNILKYPELYTLATNLIKQGVNICVIMIGLPGSGKSVLSSLLMDVAKTAGLSYKRFYTEYYYASGRSGIYDEFNAKLNYTPFKKDTSNVKIIDNLNLVAGQYYKYIQLAKQAGYVCIVFECKVVDLNILASRNIHGLTYDNLLTMSQKTLSLQESTYAIIIPNKTITSSISSDLNTLTVNNPLMYITCPTSLLTNFTNQNIFIAITGLATTPAGQALIIQQNAIPSANNYFVININFGYTADDVANAISPSNTNNYNSPIPIQGVYGLLWI